MRQLVFVGLLLCGSALAVPNEPVYVVGPAPVVEQPAPEPVRTSSGPNITFFETPPTQPEPAKTAPAASSKVELKAMPRVDIELAVMKFCRDADCIRRGSRLEEFGDSKNTMITRYALQSAPGAALETYYDTDKLEYAMVQLVLPREIGMSSYPYTASVFVNTLKAGAVTRRDVENCLESSRAKSGSVTLLDVGREFETQSICSWGANSVTGKTPMPTVSVFFF